VLGLVAFDRALEGCRRVHIGPQDGGGKAVNLRDPLPQSHATVHSALSAIGHTLRPTNSAGDPTGEVLFNIEPRSYLIAGSLNEFKGDNGINEAKYCSFESYRRNVKKPEIITFDELLH
jgi:hypothetical protein